MSLSGGKDETKKQRQMAYYGYEKDRHTLKFRCPSAVYGLKCDGYHECLEKAGSSAIQYGRTVRISLDKVNRRIFTPVITGSPSWKRTYARRSALERIFSRVDQTYGMEHHYVRGLNNMHLRISLDMLIMMALGHVRAGRAEQMRSLGQPVPLLDTG